MFRCYFCVIAFLTATVYSNAGQSPATTNAPGNQSETVPEPKPSTGISVQEMLATGPTQLKLHSLAMVSQGNIKGEVDESYLPGFKVCAEDPALPLRSVTAQLLGKHFIKDKDTPNPEAVDLVVKLAKDESDYVRYNAIYYGLTEIKNKSDEIIGLLVDIAADNCEPSLFQKIGASLEGSRDEVVKVLNEKLENEDSIALFEIYEDLTGQAPPDMDKYLNMPCSRTKLFVFKGNGGDSEAFKSKLAKELESIGIEHPEVIISGSGDKYALLYKAYLTKDRLAVESHFDGNETFTVTQTMWLTPELEVQIESMRF